MLLTVAADVALDHLESALALVHKLRTARLDAASSQALQLQLQLLLLLLHLPLLQLQHLVQALEHPQRLRTEARLLTLLERRMLGMAKEHSLSAVNA